MKLLCLLLSILMLLSACSTAETTPNTDLPPSEQPNGDPPTQTTPPIQKDHYYFLLFNSSKMSSEDLAALEELSTLYPRHEVYRLDVKDCHDAVAVYELMQRESASKSGIMDGVQIMGTANMVPAFQVDYKIKLPDSYDINDSFCSDYFYSNFDNLSSSLEQFNIADHFESDRSVSLTPRWRVARLLLIRGQFSDYLENYKQYLAKSQGNSPQIVSFSSSIFRYFETTSVDDMAYFMQRAEQEWNLVKSPRLYTNQQGSYLSPVPALGDITTQNMSLENQRAISEFFLLGHGSKNTVIRSVFDPTGRASTSAYLSSEELYKTFQYNPYFLNIHACISAQGMNAGLVRTALSAGCIGAFAATSVITNNGINCKVPLEEMQSSSNFFAFYYAYLNGLNTGLSRSRAFFAAQVEWEQILSSCANREIVYSANYQFGYHNLLCYHNFGIFEPDTV